MFHVICVIGSNAKGKSPVYFTTITCRCMFGPAEGPCLILDTSHRVATSNKRLGQPPCLLLNHLVNMTQSTVPAVYRSLPVSPTRHWTVWMYSRASSQGCTWTGSWWFSAAPFYAAGHLEGCTPPAHKQDCVTVHQGYLTSQQFSCHTTVPAETLNSCTHIWPIHNPIL